MFRQVVGTLFRLAGHYEDRWMRVKGSHPIPEYGFERVVAPEEVKVIHAKLIDHLEQAASDASLCRALREADALGHLDDAQRRDLGRPTICHAGADPDEVACSARVGEGQQDAVRGLAPSCHQAWAARISDQRVTRYGLSSSN
jgi:hypothetical protein